MASLLSVDAGMSGPTRTIALDHSVRDRMPRRLHLFVLAIAAALPILIFSVVMIVLFDRAQQKSVEQMLRQNARSAMAAIDRELADHIAALEALAASPRIDAEDMAEFYSHARRVLDSRHEWLTMRLSDARTHRQIINLLTPLGETLPSALDPDDIDAVVKTRRPLIGPVRQPDAQDTEPYVILRAPVVRDGVVLYTLSASLRAAAFSEILIDQSVPPGWVSTVIDKKSNIVGRSRAHEEFVGTPAALPLDVELAGGRDGFSFARTREGGAAYAGFSHSPFSDWTVAVVAPANVVEQPLRRSLFAIVGGGGLALALAVLLASALIRNYARRQDAERRLTVLGAEQAAERRLANIAANFPGLIYRRMLHPDGRISFPYLSDQADAILGVKPDFAKNKTEVEAFGRHWLVPEDLPRWRDAILDSARTLQPYRLEYRVRDPGGEIRWVRSMAYTRREPDGATVWDGVMLDISDLKETELALRDSDERLRLAVEATELGTWDWSPRTAEFTWSDRAKTVFGLPPDAVVNYRVFLAHVHREDRQRTHRALKRTLMPGGSAELKLEFRTLWPDGSVHWVAARGQAIFDEQGDGGNAVRFIGTVRDITGRKSDEAALAAALEEKDSLLQQKDTLLREIHHRVKNNLQVISSLMNLEALQVEDESARERLKIVSQRIVILGSIHEQLYRSDDFAHIDIGERLKEICRNLADLYNNPDVAVDVKTEPLFCNIEAAIPLGLITNELVSNCFKHGFRDGAAGQVDVALRRTDAGAIMLVVADNGAGLAEGSQMPRPGLGLRVVTALAKQISAEVRFESEGGTRVTLTIPGNAF